MKNLLMSFNGYIFLLAFLPAVVVQKCDNKNGGDKYQYPDAKIEMTRTACFGKCPQYTIQIDGSGMASYTGIQNVEKIGKYEKQLTTAEINTLVDAFENANFWDFEEEYTADVTDLPTTYISYERDSKMHKVKDYYGAPDKLKQLEKAVEALANTSGWEEVVEE